MEYYNNVRCAQLLNITTSPEQVSYTGTIYYREVIPIIQRCIHVRGFPNLSARIIYEKIMPKTNPTIETHYVLYNWAVIWKNLSSVFVIVNEKFYINICMKFSLQRKG